MNCTSIKSIALFLSFFQLHPILATSPGNNRDRGFTENKGQVVDQLGHLRSDVLFYNNAGEMSFHLRKNGISYQLFRTDSVQPLTNKLEIHKRGHIVSQTVYRLDLNLLGASNDVKVSREKPLQGFSNFYSEACPDGLFNVRSYSELRFQEVYPGIDLHYYFADGALKYDYVLKVGANYKDIQIKIEGAESIVVDAFGKLVMHTPLGDVIEEPPLVFQNAVELPSRWKVLNGIVSFEVQGADPSKPMVIDPVVRVWGTYFGGLGDDYIEDCVTDENGNVYATGTLGHVSTGFATSGAHQLVTGTGDDAVLVKFDSTGARLWSTYYGGSGTDDGISVVIDTAGFVYLYGSSSSTAAIATSGAYQATYGGSVSDAFIAKFNSAGVRQWGTYFGGLGFEIPTGCAADSLGHIYIVGASSSSNAISTPGTYQSTFSGFTDAYLAKFSYAGVMQWGTYMGKTSSEEFAFCSPDPFGNVFVAGNTHPSHNTGTLISSPACHQPTVGGNWDGFLMKFSPTGNRLWGTYYGGTNLEYGTSCAADAFGNVFLCGYSASTGSSVIATPGSFQSSNAGSADMYIAKFDSSGTRQWGTYFGSTGSDNAYYCKMGPTGDLYVCGGTNSNSGGLATAAVHQTSYGGGAWDGFISRWTAMGQLVWSSYYGGLTHDVIMTCAPFGKYNVFVGGFQEFNGGGIATSNGFQPAFSQSVDGWVARLNECVVPPNAILTSAPAQTICAGTSATISAYGNGLVRWFSTPAGGTPVATGTLLVTSTLTPGTYSFYAENMSCMSSTLRVMSEITSIGNPSITVSSGSVCSGQSYSLNPQGAASYLYVNGAAVVAPLSTTTFTVYGLDANGCVSPPALSTVVVHITPTISVSNGSICTGESYTINPSGADSYSISGGSFTVSPAVTTVYTITAENISQCIDPDGATLTITVHSLPTLSVNSGTICAGSAFTIQPSGAATYSATGGSLVVSPPASTAIIVSGKSAQGCPAVGTVTSSITVNPLPVISVSSGSVCPGETFVFTPSGALSYSIAGATMSVQPFVNTTYTVVGTDANGCVNEKTVTIVVKPTPTLLVSSGSICAGGIFTITAYGASSYSFPLNTNTVQPLSSTVYTIMGAGVNGCTASATSSVTVHQLPVVSVNNGSVCLNGSFTLVPAGGVNYLYSSGSPVVTPAVTANYTVFSVSVQGCVSPTAAIATVSVVALPLVTVGSGSICVGASFTLQPSGAQSFSYSGGSQVVAPQLTTVYTVTGTASSGCQSVAQATVTVHNIPVLTVTGNNTACVNDTILLFGSGASTYSWSSGQSTPSYSIVAVSDHTVTLFGFGLSGCADSVKVAATVHGPPTVAIVASSSVCNGSPVMLQANGNASAYLWSTGAQGSTALVAPTTNTVFSVVATNSAGCVASSAHSITVFQLPVVAVQPTAAKVCAGQSHSLTASGALNYLWSGGVLNNVPFTVSATQVYTVLGYDTHGCSASAQSTLVVLPVPQLLLQAPSQSICAGDLVTLTVSGFTPVIWNTSDTANTLIVQPLVSTDYFATAVNDSGCASTKSITVQVFDCTDLNENHPAAWKVYPNPNSGLFYVEGVNGVADVSYSIISYSGAKVAEGKVKGDVYELDGRALAKGVYLIRLSNSEGHAYQTKIIID